MNNPDRLSIVVSVYNEEAALCKFYEACDKVMRELDCHYELLFVNDGSVDSSADIIDRLAEKDPHVKGVFFSRNFGHESAMLAGIDYAEGDYIICMDADLQHPVACIPKMLKLFREGTDVISMVRTSNKDAGLVKNLTSPLFYKLINALSDDKMEENASDFFGISARVARVLRENFRENVRFVRGYIQNMGFKRCVMEYAAADRVAGESKYSIKKLMRFSMNTIMCFSDVPLKAGIPAGIITGILAFICFIVTLVFWIRDGALNAFAALAFLMLLLGAFMFLILGVLGAYLGVLMKEVRNRPTYIVERTTDNVRSRSRGIKQ